MQGFQYLRPTSLDEALDLLAEEGRGDVRPIAGGTDLIPAWRSGRLSVDRLVDLAGLGLDRITETETEIGVGALTTFTSLLRSPLIQRELPLLVRAARSFGAAQTRSLATMGGNLASGVPSMDAGPPLMVLDARVRIAGRGKERLVPVAAMFSGPRRTVLQTDEVLTEILIPRPKRSFGAAFGKFGRRKALTLAIVNAAAGLRLNTAGAVEEVRLALGAVAPTPIRARRAEEQILGRKPSPDLFARAAATAAQETAAISDLRGSAAYRRALTAVLARRALEQAWHEAEGGGKGA